MYRGYVVRNETIDPEYRVKFNFISERYEIRDGVAIFIRQAPTPKVLFDDYTDYLVERYEIDDDTISNLKLEIGKTVCDYIFSTMELKKI